MVSKTIKVHGEEVYISDHVLQRLIERGVKGGYFTKSEVSGRSQLLISELLNRSKEGFFSGPHSHGEGYLYDNWLFVKIDNSIVTAYIRDPNEVEFHAWDSEVFTPSN